ncbi:hypothetical protein [Parasedimentitalea maritima]|uniref:hypothetical protein n=1 Tax=Parasedimentitalea maritima TaxID=2578117 RepID=UPI00148596F1|nr:hypothetical protein [Zongyanglinia marina]
MSYFFESGYYGDEGIMSWRFTRTGIYLVVGLSSVQRADAEGALFYGFSDQALGQ